MLTFYQTSLNCCGIVLMLQLNPLEIEVESTEVSSVSDNCPKNGS